ncbi:MAG: nitroreductase family protein [Lachnospiraceae bacterium]|nr:nitroreductase family protein [Candidatus Colinaster equi]
MELTQAIETRRSIRAYKADATVTKDQICEMIKAAGQAPSWKNSQTARYYVAMSDEMMNRVKDECLPEFNANNCVNAKALIVTAFETKRAGFDREGNPDTELHDEWGAYDLGLQTQNLLLKARDMSLDTLVMGIRNGEKLREIFAIPDSQMVVSVISVGVRENTPDMPKRKEVDAIAKFF